jgi:hypothetical protein
MMASNFITLVPPFIPKHNFFKDGVIKALGHKYCFSNVWRATKIVAKIHEIHCRTPQSSLRFPKLNKF